MSAEIMYFYRYGADSDIADSERAQGTENDVVSKVLQTYSSYNSIIHTRH
jgi:hypothetical protein